MESIKDFTIATVFILVTSTALLFFALGYPALNNQDSVLLGNEKFNETVYELSDSLSEYQTQQNVNINISTADEPQASAQGLYLISDTATSRNMMSQLFDTFQALAILLGGVFGLNGREFTFVSATLLSLFSMVLLYYTIKVIRWGQ